MSEPTLSEQEVLDVLHAIERGEVTIPEEQRKAAAEVYCGNVEFTCSNGWRFTIFNDCDEWDYIDEVTAPDGRMIRSDDIAGVDVPFGSEPMRELYLYAPPVHLAMGQWGIPT